MDIHHISTVISAFYGLKSDFLIFAKDAQLQDVFTLTLLAYIFKIRKAIAVLIVESLGAVTGACAVVFVTSVFHFRNCELLSVLRFVTSCDRALPNLTIMTSIKVIFISRDSY